MDSTAFPYFLLACVSILCFLLAYANKGLRRKVEEAKHFKEEIQTNRENAENAIRLKNDFLANISHEIRTPMNAIIGLNHLALQTDLTPKQHHYLTQLESASRGLLRIIDDILDFSSIETGTMHLDRVPFRLDSILDELAALTTVDAEKKGLEIFFNLDEKNQYTLLGDPLRLSQILLNLSINAIKFTSFGEIIVTVRKVKQKQRTLTLLFSVADTGIGIETERLHTIFESFTQVDSSTTRRVGGSGLGLAISKKLVEMMGGTIDVRSSLGEGSEFFFEIPFEIISQTGIPPLHGTKVLVVDDNVIARNILSETLKHLQCEVVTANNGEQALEKISESIANGQQYSIVLLDWKMPGMTGLETAQRINELFPSSAAPTIIMVTAYNHNEITQQARNVGIREVLIKPVSPSSLFDVLVRVYDPLTPESMRVHHESLSHHAALPGIHNLARSSLSSPYAASFGSAHSLSPYSTIDLTPTSKQSSLEGIRILLVEDNPLNQQVALELLELQGAVVAIAENGQQALEKAPIFQPRIILMDIQMPVMDGLECTTRLRANPQFQHTPILAMTAHAANADRAKSLAAGMQDHITKPIDPLRFYATLRLWATPDSMTAPANILHCAATPSATERPTQPNRMTLLPPEHGPIDFTEAMVRMQGNEELFYKLLHTFTVNYAHCLDEINAATTQSDSAGLFQLLHTLKGVSGTLSMNRLYNCTCDLEDHLLAHNFEQQEQFTELLTTFTINFTAAMQSAHKFLCSKNN